MASFHGQDTLCHFFIHIFLHFLWSLHGLQIEVIEQLTWLDIVTIKEIYLFDFIIRIFTEKGLLRIFLFGFLKLMLNQILLLFNVDSLVLDKPFFQIPQK
jgi:hypothetical protein